MHLDPDFKEFVESFIAHDVRFLVVGGYAVAAHAVVLQIRLLTRGGRRSWFRGGRYRCVIRWCLHEV